MNGMREFGDSILQGYRFFVAGCVGFLASELGNANPTLPEMLGLVALALGVVMIGDIFIKKLLHRWNMFPRDPSLEGVQ